MTITVFTPRRPLRLVATPPDAYHPAERAAYRAIAAGCAALALAYAEEARDAYALSMHDERCSRMTRLALLLHEEGASVMTTRPARIGRPVASEASEQEALMEFCTRFSGQVPVLARVFHIPNGEARDARVGAKLKRMGVKPGMPDLCLPVPWGAFHGLYIELKRADGGRTRLVQGDWHAFLRGQNYAVVVAAGWVEAARAMVDYLGLRPERFGL
ncbi:MAG: hypothetical protein WCG26_01515 [Chloroflexales bacterium]